MRIGIDARFVTHPQPGGFKTYSEQLIAALASRDDEHEYVLYLDRRPEAGLELPRGARVRHRVLPGTLPWAGMVWREQVALALAASRDRLDVLHALCLTAPLAMACPLVLTIHDMIWRRPRQFQRAGAPAGRRALMDGYYRLIPALAARRATAIIAVSEAAKRDVVAELRIAPECVTVTHEAAKPGYRLPASGAAAAAVRGRFQLGPGYLLAIGSADPRKNLDTLLHAYAALPAATRERHQLAIVWTHRHLAAALAALAAKLGIGQQVRFLEQVSDQELAALYAGAAVFAFPSRYEGFGLPLLEAMACGAPIVAADNSSIPEIVGEAALLFPTEDRQALTAALLRVLSDGELVARLLAEGVERARAFSWERCAAETVQVYAEAYRRRGAGVRRLQAQPRQ